MLATATSTRAPHGISSGCDRDHVTRRPSLAPCGGGSTLPPPLVAARCRPRRSPRRRPGTARSANAPPASTLPTEEPARIGSGDGASTSGSERSRLVVSERVGSTCIRRYVVGEGGVRVEEGLGERQLATAARNEGAPPVLRLPQLVRDFFLPAGFPESVSRDFLVYLLWQFPTNITGWTCSTLVTSTLLKAVGVGAGPESAAAAAAAIKWVTKDGIGAVGRLFVGGRFGSLFDEDPKQWRMCADLIGSAGSIFELATPLWPESFLLLASFGNLTKAVAKGLKDPSARVIQTHLAATGNVGDIVAKEEVWAVMAQLIGLGIGVLILRDVERGGSYWELVEAWTAVRSVHLVLRFYSLNCLRLETINYKRAAILVHAHTRGLPVPDVVACNERENLLMPRALMEPRIVFGCSLEDLLGPGPIDPALLREVVETYEGEDYLLAINGSPGQHCTCIALKSGASATTLLRGMYHAYLLHSLEPSVGTRQSQGESVGELRTSLAHMQASFGSFLDELEAAMWKLSNLVLKPPTRSHVLNLEWSREHEILN